MINFPRIQGTDLLNTPDPNESNFYKVIKLG